ncbi:MAG TPA: monofunctional biosynthetic peptidoglycan transglycosylase [Thermoanaerobaculia bacterium]|nr:monofunctional biosynthetic peptidoglycan transglycosylase [Thermoanaerobaculia bacterium]
MIAPPYDPPRRGRVKTALLALLVLGVLYTGWTLLTWPDVAALAEEDPESTAFIDDYRGWGLFGGKKEVEWKWVPYSRISSNLKRAILVSEDIEFFQHDGFSDREMRQALEKAWEEKELPRGASTITQQLAKNLYLSPSRNPLRKVKEAVLTRQLEEHLTKRRIFEIYLNVVEFGPGIYGAEAAARHYYGKSARSLTTRQAAELAASLPRPRSWNPDSKDRGYRWKVRLIERRMGKAGWLRRVV